MTFAIIVPSTENGGKFSTNSIVAVVILVTQKCKFFDEKLEETLTLESPANPVVFRFIVKLPSAPVVAVSFVLVERFEAIT